jgi:pyruvate dehydrogenase E1 component beta subunit
VRTVKEAADQLAAEGEADAEIIDVRTISPFDFETVIASVSKTGRAVIVHEAPRTCGFGAEISAEIAERAVLHLQAPVQRITGFDTIPPLAKLEDYYQPDASMVVDAVKSLMRF